MAKAADAFRTISEVSTELDVPKHVLRFWEQRFKQLKPLKRGGGRRFYRPEDVELIRGIQTLLNRDAYTIRGVQRILREHGVERVKGLAAGSVTAPLEATVPTSLSETASASPSSSRAQAAKRKASRSANVASSEMTLVGRDVVAAAISELAACRALLVGDPVKTRSQSTASAATSRR